MVQYGAFTPIDRIERLSIIRIYFITYLPSIYVITTLNVIKIEALQVTIQKLTNPI